MKKGKFEITVQGIKEFKLEYSFYQTENSKKDSVPIFLYFHGLPGGPLHELFYIPQMLGVIGFDTIAFNYPGMWSKNGMFNSTDVIKGIDTLLDHIKQKYQLRWINLFGQSFGGAVALSLLGRETSPIPIKNIILQSPVLDIKPLSKFLPQSLSYLKQAGIINTPSIKNLLEDVKVLDPTQFYEKILKITDVNIWGIIGKNDEVLPPYKMLDAIKNYPSIRVELWNDFPHNDIDDHIYRKFINKMKEEIIN